ncbi:MAG: hypothetical protein IKU72_04920 [Oscillospiraceae bacterium]|nr:hypothetical protein [Oscillospiraceae bacterium]
MKHSAEYRMHTHKNHRCSGIAFLAVIAMVIIGLAVLFANGLFFQVMFVPVIFGGVYAATCLCFDIIQDLSHSKKGKWQW